MSEKEKHVPLNEPDDPEVSQEIDSKFRLIILAAKRAKQLKQGASPRIDIDADKHKSTRIALEEVMRGKVTFARTDAKEDLPRPSLLLIKNMLHSLS